MLRTLDHAKLAVIALLASFLVVSPLTSNQQALASVSPVTCGAIAYEGGDGLSSVSPIQISSSQALSNTVNCPAGMHYILTSDIDRSLGDPATVQVPIATFSGTLDGDGHSITNISISGNANVALFARASNAEFKNLSLSDSVIKATGNFAAVLVAEAAGEITISNLVVTRVRITAGNEVGALIGRKGYEAGAVNISGIKASNLSIAAVNKSGGLVGYGGTKVNFNDVKVTNLTMVSNEAAGGLIGGTQNFTINNSSVASFSVSAGPAAGGLVGWLINGTAGALVRDSSVTGLSMSAGDSAGGIIGKTQTILVRIIDSSVTSAKIAGRNLVGGFIGYLSGPAEISGASVTDVSIRASVGDAGGILGHAQTTSISVSSVTSVSALSANSNAGGVVGVAAGPLSIYKTGVSQVMVTGLNAVGGLVGLSIQSLNATESYFVGTLTGNAPGGLVGSLSSPVSTSFDNSYFSATGANPAIGQAKVSSVWVTTSSGFGAVPISDAAGQLPETYVGWDFLNTWVFEPSNTFRYPLLRSGYLFVTGVTVLFPVVASSPEAAAATPNETAAPTPYFGPLPTGVSNKISFAEELLTISGSRLSSVTLVTVDGLVATISGQTEATLVVTVPAGLIPGFKDIVFVSSFGKLNYLAAFQVTTRPVATEAPSPISSQKLNALAFEGFITIYAKGYEGKKLAAKVAGRWLKIDALDSDFEKVLRFTGGILDIKVAIYVDGQLQKEIELLTR